MSWGRRSGHSRPPILIPAKRRNGCCFGLAGVYLLMAVAGLAVGFPATSAHAQAAEISIGDGIQIVPGLDVIQLPICTTRQAINCTPITIAGIVPDLPPFSQISPESSRIPTCSG